MAKNQTGVLRKTTLSHKEMLSVRNKLHIGYVELADILGKSPRIVNSYLNGDREVAQPVDKLLNKIVDEYKDDKLL